MTTAARTARLAVPVLLASGLTLAAGGALGLTLDGWVVRVLGALALVVGAYVALVGVGLLRVRRAATRRAAADRDTDRRAAHVLAEAGVLSAAGVLSTAGRQADSCGDTEHCASCSGGCALSALRR